MKKRCVTNGKINGAKRGAMILAAALILGGCGGQAKDETTAAETTVEQSAEESSAEETTKAETAAESEETAEESEESTEAAAEKTEESEPAAEVAAEEAEPAAAEAVSGVTPASIYKTIGEKVALPSMMEGDDSFISNYYGINPADLDGYVFASAEDATLADSIIIMKAKSEDSVSAIVGSLNTIIEQKSAEMENYLPEQYDIVAKSSVKTEGSYVYLVISKDAGDIESVIQSALK